MTAPARSNDAEPYDADFAPAAALIADPTRAAILRALLPDRPLAAGELARLAEARTCYDHLAGRAGVELLFELGWIDRGSSGQRRRSVRVTPAGAEGLARTFGLDLVGSCRSCEKS